MDVELFLKQYADFLVPMLDTYEQAIYLYAVRHSRLIDREDITIGFNAAARRGAFGVGNSGAGMSPDNCRKKVKSLQAKGCLIVLSSDHGGFRIAVKLPDEVPGLIPTVSTAASVDPEQIDFFETRQNRELILEREGYKCFYCLRRVDTKNYVLEHVIAQAVRGNGYRNVVAACRHCNNRKGSSAAEDYLRRLYREGLLNQSELETRLEHLERLRSGNLRPDFQRAVAKGVEREENKTLPSS
jgi:hypothetical protein